MQVYFFLFVVVPMMRGKGELRHRRSPGRVLKAWSGKIPSPAPFHTFENPPKLDVTATRVIG